MKFGVRNKNYSI